LSKSKNSAAKNYELQEKKKKYLEKRVSDYPRSIQVLEYDVWTPNVLRERQQKLLNQAYIDIFR
jgi:hypothetical protein